MRHCEPCVVDKDEKPGDACPALKRQVLCICRSYAGARLSDRRIALSVCILLQHDMYIHRQGVRLTAAISRR